MFTVTKGTQPNKKDIIAAIKTVEDNKDRYQLLDEYYLGKHRILTRYKAGILKNTRIVVNHAKYITNVNTGYLLGNPIEYQVKEGNIDPLIDAYNEQGIAMVDNQIVKDMSKFGRSYEYTYVDEDGAIITKKIDPRHCVIVYDNTLDHGKEYGIIYTEVKNKKYKDVMVITAEDVQFWDEDLNAATSSTPHIFETVPLVEYSNNDDQIGDYEDVMDLMDAYNLLQSDRINDKEQLVEALLILSGIKLTAAQTTQLKVDRILAIPAVGAKAEYLVKQLVESEIEVLKKSIEQDIHKISMTPNLSDQEFVGNSSGVAIKYKLIAFEQSTKNKQTFLEKGLLDRFDIYKAYLSVKKNMEDVKRNALDMKFKRSLPSNDLETSQIITNLEGQVSQETLIGELSFVSDAKKEVEWTKEAKQADLKMQMDQFGNNTPNTGGNDFGKTNNNLSKTKK